MNNVHRDASEMRFPTSLLAVVLIALAALAYVPLVSAGWVWDDDSYVTRNALLLDPEGLAAIWTPGATPQFYPLVFTSFWIEAQLYGEEFAAQPLGFHLVNWAFHVGSALLLWRVLLRYRVPGAWLAAALFAVHPMQVESVAWVSERKNVMALFLALLSIRCWIAKDEAAGRERNGWYVASLLLFAMAMLAKTMVAALAPALVAIDLWRRTPLGPKRLLSILPFFAVGVPLGALTAWIEDTHVGASGSEFALSIADRVVLAPRSGLWYLWTWLWPSGLSFVYERWEVSAANPLQWLPLIAAMALAGACIVAWRRGIRGPAVLAALFVASLFPALGFFNVYPFRFSFVADHFAYVATPVLAAASAWCLVRVAARLPSRVAIAGAGLLLGGLATVSMGQGSAYRDEETLWRRTLATNSRAWMPASNLAGLLVERAGSASRAGDATRATALASEAEVFARQAVELFPASFSSWLHLSECLRIQGHLPEALSAAQESLKREARFPDTHWMIGRLLELEGDTNGAIDAYRLGATLPEAIRQDTADSAQTLARRADYARVLMIAGRDAEAIDAWKGVLELAPNDPRVHGAIGLAYERLGDWTNARISYHKAISRTDVTRAADLPIVLQVLPRLVNALLTPPSSPEELADALTASRWLADRTRHEDALSMLLLARAEQASGVATAATTFAQAQRLADDPKQPDALRREIGRFAPSFLPHGGA